MYLIIGLGNPGKQYENTRHNVGFMCIDELSDKYNISVTTIQHKALVGKGVINGQKVILAKPQTFMNLSGESVGELASYYKVDPNTDVIIISDDIALPPGYIRVRPKGSAGGHNGLKNIILHLGTEEFRRVRIGVGEKPKKMDLADYVLGHFSSEDRDALKEGLNQAVGAIELLLEDNVDQAMNTYNKKVAAQTQTVNTKINK